MWQLDRAGGGGGGGTGDVVGPGSATDGHLVLFDGPSGKVIKDGGPVPTGGTPGGADKQIQFNNAGAFGGSSDFQWDDVSKTLTVNGTLEGTIFTHLYNTAYVSLNGDDATGEIGDLFRPFLTIAAAEAAIATASASNPFSLQLSPGEHDITGLVKKPWIVWQGAGSSVTSISSTAPIDFANATYSTGEQTLKFTNMNFKTEINTDFYAMGDVGNGHYVTIFSNCSFNIGQTWKGRGSGEEIYYYTCFSHNTPNVWISVSVQSFATPWFTDGATPLNTLESQNGLESQLLAFSSLYLGAIYVTGNATALLSMVGSVSPGGITVDQATSVAYFLSASTFGSVPVSTNGGVIIYVTTTDAVTNASAIPGATTTDALNALNSSRVVGPGSAVDSNFAQFDTTTGKLIKDGGLSLSTDNTFAANSNSLIPSQAAAKTYIDNIIAAANAMVYKGVIDASSNPNYPAADAGWTYVISVAGKIGGASGPNVELGDVIICTADGTVSGDQATVGAFWNIIQKNLDGAVIGPASSVSGNVALFSGTSGKLIVDGGTYSGIGGSTTQVQFNNGGVYAGDPGFTWTSATDTLGIGEATAATGKIAFKGLTSGTVTLSTADAAGTWTMKLPATAGTANQLLQTDGSGNTTWASIGSGDVAGPVSAVDSNFVQFNGTTGKLVKDSGLSFDTDPTLAANSNTRIASQAAIKAYADQLIGTANAMVYKGVIDASTNPNYPAADAGWTYIISVAGKIGGASGINVEVGDMIICTTDGTVSGNQATVGAFWNIIQKNLDGAVIGPASSTNGNLVLFDGTTGKLLKDGGPPSAGSISTGVANKIPYYNTTTTLVDTNAGSAASGMFWNQLVKGVSIGNSNTFTNTGTPQNGLMVGDTQTTYDITASILAGATNTFTAGGKLNGSLFSGVGNTGLGGTLNYSIYAGNGLVLPTGSDVVSASAIVGSTHKIFGTMVTSAIFGDNSINANASGALSSGSSNWIKPPTSATGHGAIGRYLSVFGHNAIALSGSAGLSDRSIALANSCLLQGGPESAGAGVVAHYNSSEYGQVMGKQCAAGNRVYTWTRSGTTITVSQTTDIQVGFRESIPLEFVNGGICRFFQMTSISETQHEGVQTVDVAINSVPAVVTPYVDFSFTVASAAPFGTKTSGKIVALAGAEYGFASGKDASARYQGQFARSNGRFLSPGDAQISDIVMRKLTTNATPTVMTLDGGTTKFLRVPLGIAWGFTITVVGRRDGNFDTVAMFKFEGLVSRKQEADDPVIIGTTAVLINKSDPAWDCTLGINTTNNSLDLTVTGGAYDVKWVARVELTEVSTSYL